MRSRYSWKSVQSYLMNAQTNLKHHVKCIVFFNSSDKKKQKDKEDVWAQIEAQAAVNGRCWD